MNILNYDGVEIVLEKHNAMTDIAARQVLQTMLNELMPDVPTDKIPFPVFSVAYTFSLIATQTKSAKGLPVDIPTFYMEKDKLISSFNYLMRSPEYLGLTTAWYEAIAALNFYGE